MSICFTIVLVILQYMGMIDKEEKNMSGFGIGSIMFVVLALLGLVFLVVGIIFVVKNIKWKKEKDLQGISSTMNIVAIVLFSIMIFFGAIWLFCFGAGAIVFGVLEGTM